MISLVHTTDGDRMRAVPHAKHTASSSWVRKSLPRLSPGVGDECMYGMYSTEHNAPAMTGMKGARVQERKSERENDGNVERDEDRHGGASVVHTRAGINVCCGQRMRCTVIVEIATHEFAGECTALVLRADHLPQTLVVPQSHRSTAIRLRAVDGLVHELLLCAHGCVISYRMVM